MGEVKNFANTFRRRAMDNIQQHATDEENEALGYATEALYNINQTLIALQQVPEIGITEFFEVIDFNYTQAVKHKSFPKLMRHVADFHDTHMFESCPKIKYMTEQAKIFRDNFDYLPENIKTSLLHIHMDSHDEFLNALEQAAYPNEPDHRENVIWLDLKL